MDQYKNIINLSERKSDVVQTLLVLWENSVRGTHTFLPEEEIDPMKPFVREGILNSQSLLGIEEDHQLKAFMVVENHKIEMLFVDLDSRGKGFGKKLVRYAIDQLGVQYVDVNQQNDQAFGFYERLGFQTSAISQFDDFGKPYPILHLKLTDKM